MRVEVVRHVIDLRLHVGAELSERRGRDEVALAVDLPRDRRVLRADFVVAARTGRRARVVGDVLPVFMPDAAFVIRRHVLGDHAFEEVGVVVERRSRVLCRRAMHGSEIQAKYGNSAWNFVGAMYCFYDN